MKVLIVHAHHEPKSFSSALARRAEKSLKAQGHIVDFADLYQEQFDPVSDRRNFSSVADANFLKQQAEETLVTEIRGFSPELEKEIVRLESCDALIFSFPLWWFGMPAILKGWVDRVFASSRIYGGPKIYENGLGKSKKRGLVLMTTGGGPDVYGGYGVNPSLKTIMEPIQHGIFWFNGFLPLAPFIAWSPVRATQDERNTYSDELESRLKKIETEPPIILPPLSDFPNWGKDAKKRFMVTVTRTRPVDDKFRSLIAAEQAHIAEWKRLGIILDFRMMSPQAEPWRAYIIFREVSSSEVGKHLELLPLAPWLEFHVDEIL